MQLRLKLMRKYQKIPQETGAIVKYDIQELRKGHTNHPMDGTETDATDMRYR